MAQIFHINISIKHNVAINNCNCFAKKIHMEIFIKFITVVPGMSGHFINVPFYHVNVPMMRGHLVNADRIFWFSAPAKAVIIIFVIFFSKYFISKMATDKQRGV